MSNFEFKTSTKFGDITIHFDNKEDLEKRLQEIEEFIRVIEKSKIIVLQVLEIKVMPGLEDIYTIGPDGLPKLLRFPKSKSDIIRLALFVSPRPLSLDEITKVTGVKPPASYMKGNHFVKLSDGTYTLEASGKSYVSSKIISKLKTGDLTNARS